MPKELLHLAQSNEYFLPLNDLGIMWAVHDAVFVYWQIASEGNDKQTGEGCLPPLMLKICLVLALLTDRELCSMQINNIS